MTTRATDNRSRMSAPLAAIRSLARRAISMEIAIWMSLYRFVFRRPRVPAGAVGFAYHGQVWTLLMIFIGLSAIEIPIIDLIVHRWPVVRISFLILGLWGLTWMIGLALGFVTRPHSVGPNGIRARNGAETDLGLDWDDILSVAIARRTDEPKSQRVETDGSAHRTLALRMQNETNITIEFERPLTLTVPSGAETVHALRIWVDDPRAFLEEVRRYL